MKTNLLKKLFKTLGLFFSLLILTLIFYNSVIFGIKLMSYRQDATTPDIKGEKVEDALRILHANKLGMTLLEEQYSAKVPKGRIINQFPAPGVKLKVDRNVRVIVSTGTESMYVPDLIGKTLKSAELTLERFSLKKGKIAFTYSSEIESNHVIAQNPPIETLVFKRDEINLLLSKGPKERFFVMPDLIEKTLDQAINKLRTLKLPLDRVTYQFNEMYPDNIVINQSPELGYPVSDQMGVTLTVNQKIKKQKEENKFFIFSHILPRGYKKLNLELVLVTNKINRRTLQKGSYNPGYNFKYLISAPIGSEIELLLDGKVAKLVPVR